MVQLPSLCATSGAMFVFGAGSVIFGLMRSFPIELCSSRLCVRLRLGEPIRGRRTCRFQEGQRKPRSNGHLPPGPNQFRCLGSRCCRGVIFESVPQVEDFSYCCTVCIISVSLSLPVSQTLGLMCKLRIVCVR